MSKKIQKLAEALGARVVSELPDTGGGAFGAARLGHIVAELQTELTPKEDRDETLAAVREGLADVNARRTKPARAALKALAEKYDITSSDQ